MVNIVKVPQRSLVCSLLGSSFPNFLNRFRITGHIYELQKNALCAGYIYPSVHYVAFF